MKEKISVSVDEEVIDILKMQRINISEVTETALAAYALTIKPERTVKEAYQELFDFILPMLKKFDCKVKIAKIIEPTSFDIKGKVQKYNVPYDVFLNPDGSAYIDGLERHLNSIKEISSKNYLEPLEILSNLVDALAEDDKIRTEKIQEIEMARNIVEAICKTLTK